MSSAIGFVGWDSSAHLAEEMVNVSRDLPRTSEYKETLTRDTILIKIFSDCEHRYQRTVDIPLGHCSCVLYD